MVTSIKNSYSGLNLQFSVVRNMIELVSSQVRGFPGGSDGKESVCSAGDLGLIPGLGRSRGGGHVSPLQCSCLENPHGQRNLEGYSPWGHKELGTTEHLSTTQHSIILV